MVSASWCDCVGAPLLVGLNISTRSGISAIGHGSIDRSGSSAPSIYHPAPLNRGDKTKTEAKRPEVHCAGSVGEG